MDKVNILLVDDRRENLLALEAVLASPEYNLVSVGSGEEALKYILKMDFAVILMDVQMPGLSGFETAKFIKERERTRHIPIIFVTAISQASEHVLEGYAIGAQEYIFKPFRPEILKAKVAALVRIYENNKKLKLQSEILRKRTSELEQSNKKLLRLTAELAKAEELARINILESISDCFISVNHDWRFIYINKQAERQMQRQREDLLGRVIWDELPELIGSNCYPMACQAMAEKKTMHIESPVVIGNRWFEYHLYPSREGLSIFYRDITERKQFQQEMMRLDRLDLVGQIAAGIGHEVRNPLTTIRGFLQLLQSKEEYQKDWEYFEVMITELDRANSIISEFLSVSKTQAQELKIQNLNEIVQAIMPLVSADALQKDKVVRVELDEFPDLSLDEKEIRQLLLNLVRNGLEAMEQGGTVTVKTYQTDEKVILEVKDQGHGIPPEIMEKVTTPFYTTKEKGTGLGLAVCYGIVERHGAEMKIDSSSMGTTFAIHFPLPVAEHFSQAQTSLNS